MTGDRRRLLGYLEALDNAARRPRVAAGLGAVAMPDIITFATDPAYLGLQPFPRQATMLKMAYLGVGPDGQELFTDYDRYVLDEWTARFRDTGEGGVPADLFERIAWNLAQGRRHFREIVFVGGRRGGKGFIGSILLAYNLWYLLSLGDPQQHFGIPPAKRLTGLVFAGQREQAKANLWRDVCDRVLGSDCFAPFHPMLAGNSLLICTPHDLERLGTSEPTARDVIVYASIEIRACGATPLSGRGPATILLGFDEMAHAHGAGSNRSAAEIYEASAPSLDQFRGDALLYEPSSPWTAGGQFYTNACNATAREPDGRTSFPDMLLWHFTSWDPYLDHELGPQIPMLPNGPAFEHLPPPPQVYDEHLQALERVNPASFAVERRAQWRRASDVYLPPAHVARLWAPLGDRTFTMQHQGVLAYEYVAHGDPSRSGANFGFAIAHREVIDGEPHVVFDHFNLWAPSEFPENDYEIDYRRVTEDLKYYLDAFNPIRMSFDTWNSAGLIDELRAHQRARIRPRTAWIHVLYPTQAENWATAETFKTALALGLVHAPYHPTLEDELLHLRFTGTRVDHPTTGECVTKDLADCAMALVKILIGDHIDAIISGQLSSQSLHAMVPAEIPAPAAWPTTSSSDPAADLSASGRAIARRARSDTPYNPARGIRRGRRR